MASSGTSVLLLRVDGVYLFHQGQYVVGGDEDIILVVEGGVPADFAVVIGHTWGNSLGGELNAHGVIVSHRLDKAQVFQAVVGKDWTWSRFDE